MNEAKQAVFESWAIVELMGHQREIGFVTTEAYGQAVLFRIDQPELPAREYTLKAPQYYVTVGRSEFLPAGSKVQRPASPARSRLVAPGSIYAINPCTEEAAREALEQSVPRPLIVIERPKQEAQALPAPDESCECDETCEDDCPCECHESDDAAHGDDL